MKIEESKEQEEIYDGDVEIMSLSADDPTLIYQNSKQLVEPQGWVKFGVNNDQFSYLQNLYISSNTHNAICMSVANMIYGDGLNVEGVIDETENKRLILDFQTTGNCVMQVTETDIYHSPIDNWRADKVDEEGNINWFWFSTDWSDSSIVPVKYPAWFEDWKPDADYDSAIYWVRQYSPASIYYGLPNFQGGLSYMEQEVEIAKFLLNYIKNNFSVTKIVNFNNGVQDLKTRKKIKKAVKEKLQGANGDTVITAFNKSKDYAATIEDVSVSNASEQYTYMTTNARSQIVVSHQIPSAKLVGIDDDGTGFSSNADEMAMARALLEEMQIIPKQQTISKAFKEIKNNPNIDYISSVDSAVKSDNKVVASNEPVKLKKVNPELEAFIGSGVDSLEGFNLFYSIDHADGKLREEIEGLVTDFESVELASTGKASPRTKSKQDKNGFAVRYRYAGEEKGEREFCNLMMSANKLYRKEDIQNMRHRAVNPGFGLNGANTYDIWLWQGGGLMSSNFPQGTCKHYWKMEVYVAESTSDSSRIKLGKKISNAVAIRNGISPLQNNKQVHTTNHSQGNK